MAGEAFEVGIVVERRRLKSPWAEFAWVPVAALPAPAAAAPWSVLAEDPDRTTFYAGAAEVALHRTETGNYRDNLATGAPTLWVSLRESEHEPGVALAIVTPDPAEGEGLTETGAAIVEAVPMPPAVRERVAAFVAAHHVERPFVKRKRDRANPEALALRPKPEKLPHEDEP
ncbi:DUF3305 domain-containing protein [Faunimonas sp. B44]|uniref:DUF3305 domain-containing protein n=1 Tax=Faunimonas sp. B44 TaxID=3461493 RepID=UPI0040443483